jgi:transcriptional regulator with XRE-family HTH domain
MMRGSLAERLRVLRAQYGLTLNQASGKIGVNRHTLRDLELGKREPYGPTIRKIAEAYNVPLAQLLEEQPPVPLDDAAKGETGQPPPSAGTVEEFEQKLSRVLEPVRAEVLHDFQAANRFFASEGIERDYGGPIAEAEVEKRFVDEFSPEERATAFGELALAYALVERAYVNLQANFTRAQKVLRERGEEIAQPEETTAKMDTYNIGRDTEEIHVSGWPSRAEAERKGVRD